MNQEEETVTVGLEKVLLKSEREEIKKKRKHRFLISLLCIILFILGFIGGVIFYNQLHPTSNADTTNTLGEIEAMIEKYWVYAKNYDDIETQLEDKAFYGMTSFDEDPYTTYMSGDELKEFATGINMDYVGIGVQYALKDDTAIIERVFANSPAEKAGILPGDIILAVDGVDIEGLDSDDIKSMVIGEAKTNVIITILRNNIEKDITVVRDAVDSSVYCYLEDDYVVMELSSFGDNTAKESMAYLDQYTNYTKLIIDLRNNTGGYQTSVKELAGLFIGNGKPYLIQEDANGNSQTDYTKCSKTYDNFEKIIVLVNGNTASAAEVFAICLSEQMDNVTLLGDTTYGKGVIQSTHYLRNGGVLKLTTYNWYSPNGISINKVGITPDIEIRQADIYYEEYINMDEEDIYEYDSVSDVVKISEVALDCFGYDVDRKDGYFDDSFKHALNLYKIDNNLGNDAILDYDTYQNIVSNIVVYLSLSENDLQFNKARELINE